LHNPWKGDEVRTTMRGTCRTSTATSAWRAYGLLLALVAGCSSALDNQPPAADAGPPRKLSDGKLKLPTPELSSKHDAAKAEPESLAPVLAYAKAVTDHCLTLLSDAKAGAAEKDKAKHLAEPDPDTWLLIEDAMTRLDGLMKVKSLDAAQVGQVVVAKGRLLWIEGRGADEEALIAEHALAHPELIAVVRRRLELLREAGDVKDAEIQCARSRVRLRGAADAVRLELLTTCVALHPDNADGKSNPPDYTKFLPAASKAEQKLYRKHLVQRCVEDLGTRESRCGEACGCKARPKSERAACKQACTNCRVETAQKIRECKHAGTPAPARAARAKGKPGKAADDGPALQPTEL
jgi:hypothetical protein